jgi:osmotically-inducible protein OsmY
MKKSLLTVVLVLGLSAAVAFAQAGAGSAQSASPGNYPGQPPMSEQQPGMHQDNKSSSMANVDDETLHRQVHEQLASNPDLQNIQVSVKSGVVTLDGTVPNKADRKEAKKLAKSVPGVRSVKEHLTVNAASAAAPSSMGGVSGQASTSSATATEKEPPSGAVAGQTGATTGTTSGAATSTENQPSSSASAPPAAQEQPGISGQVGGQATPPAGEQPPAVSGQAGAQPGTQPGMGEANPNQQLQSQIETALRNEPTLSNSNVNVNVTADTIELSGSVLTGKDRQTAKRIAQSFAGNRKVVDHITVSGQGSSTEKPPQQ